MRHSGTLLSLWSCHLGQHADHKRQQFLHRVEVDRLPGNHRLDATLPVRPRLAGFSATLHDKGPIGRGRGGNGDSVISWPTTCPRGISELSSCGNLGYSMRGISVESLFKNMPGSSMAVPKSSTGVQFLFNIVRGGVDRRSHGAGTRHRFCSISYGYDAWSLVA
jgi:hypothetical protein